MSIKGFSTDNGIQRYDYNYLDNKPNNVGIFWAVYGETASDEIATAISNNKIVALNYGNHIYYLNSVSSNVASATTYLFKSEDQTANY